MTKEDEALQRFVERFNREIAPGYCAPLTLETAKRMMSVTFDENGKALFHANYDQPEFLAAEGRNDPKGRQ
jgi:hypothetical protein